MAIDNDVAMFHENAGSVYNAIEYRRMFDRMMMGWDLRAWGGGATEGTGNGGVSRAEDLEVTEKGTPDMSVDVALGGCIVGGTENNHQGDYFVYSDATVNVSITAADPTNDRIDIVGVQIEDTAYAGLSDDASITVIDGTAAASPSEPTLPDNFLTLARVDVPAAATSITDSDISDRRRRISALGGVFICASSSTYPDNEWEGQVLYDVSEKSIRVYNGVDWNKPWDLPWGYVGYAQRTTNQGSIGGTITDLTSLSVAATYEGNRNIKITGQVRVSADANATGVGFLIRESSTVLNRSTLYVHNYLIAQSYPFGMHLEHRLSPSAGAHTYKLSMVRDYTGGAANVGMHAAATYPAFILVEDIGPNGNPV